MQVYIAYRISTKLVDSTCKPVDSTCKPVDSACKPEGLPPTRKKD